MFITCSAVVLISACVMADKPQYQLQDANAGAREASLSWNLNAALESTEFITFSTPAESLTEGEKRQLEADRQALGKEIPARELTASEEARLGYWCLTEEARAGLTSTTGSIVAFFHDTGALPASGVDLFPELATKAGHAELKRLGAAELILKYHAGINPITGMFYQSFSAAEWAPGEINFEVIDAARIEKHYGAPVYWPNEYGESELVTEAYHVVVWGEAPGTVLYDGIIF